MKIEWSAAPGAQAAHVQAVDEEPRKVKSASNKPVDLTNATFIDAIQDHPLVVVDCWAPWCGPCRMVAPVIEELAQDYAGRILFGKLDIDENQTVATQYGIMSIPTLLVFKNGRLVDRSSKRCQGKCWNRR